MNHHIRKLDLSHCNVGDKDINSAVWDLPNLEELNLKRNMFSRLSFSHLRLPRLKWLNVSHCKRLVEVSELPSSIAVIKADYCRSLETFGDISNCRWLWKVSLLGDNKLVGDILLDSILQGNSIEDWFFSVALEGQVIPKGFVGRLFRRNTFVLHLPNDWYNDFCGLLICFVTEVDSPYICINIKQEVDEDTRSEICVESDEAPGLEYDETQAFLGYASFSLLRRTTFFKSSCNVISFSIEVMGCISSAAQTFGVELVPRKNKGKEVQTTDYSEYWDKEHENIKTFMPQYDSPYFLKILWQPCYSPQLRKVVMKVDIPNNTDTLEALFAVNRFPGTTGFSKDDEGKIITVVGDIDPVDIAGKLSNWFHTEIVTVAPYYGYNEL